MTDAILRFGDKLLTRMVPKVTALAGSPCQCRRRCCRVMGARAVEGYYLKRSPRMNPGDSSRPNRAATRMVATLSLGDSPSGPARTGFHAP
ncbi:MAG: hypothetical protein K0R62_6091, partial [Nonomuraea muscovyensis]|nr:hypothetical protein [Nonomuraea muscovyensis]